MSIPNNITVPNTIKCAYHACPEPGKLLSSGDFQILRNNLWKPKHQCIFCNKFMHNNCRNGNSCLTCYVPSDTKDDNSELQCLAVESNSKKGNNLPLKVSSGGFQS